MARNSAPMSTKRPAALTKARMRNSTECTGFFAAITMIAEATHTMAKSQKKIACRIIGGGASAVWRVVRDVLGDLALPPVAVREQAFLVVIELFARFGGEFEVRPLDDGIHRTGLLAQAAVDAFDHVDVVARGAAGAIVPPRSCFDGDRLRGTDRLAQLA